MRMSLSGTDLRFSVPFLPPRHLSRPRLVATVDGAWSSALTLVSAGAGAGKTVLLTGWAQRQDTPVVWLALTRADNDPRRFWRLLLEGGRSAGQVYPPAAWTSGRTVELLDFVLGRSPLSQPRLQVVLDDAHVLTDPQILDGLDRVIRRWPHRIRLLATARSDPLLPLHRYRLAGQVCEIRAADLAMTVPEARELLSAHGLALGEEDLRTLVGRTEGWAAGLRLAAMRMRGAGRPADFVADLAIDQGSVGEYLTEEVLAVQPDSVRRLLVDTSFLDEVSGPLADAITGAADGEAVLATLAKANSFVIPLDAGRTVFRYHQLFREMLRHLAARHPAELVRSRYLAAAGWYREHDDLSSAVRWTLRSGDPAATRSLLVHAGLAEVFVSRQDIAVDELRGLGDVRPDPDAPPLEALEIEVARWAVAALTTESETAVVELARLPRLGDGLESAGTDLRVTASLAELILGQKAADSDLLDAAAERLLSEPELSAAARDLPGLRASVLLVQARSRFTTGRLAEVEPLLHRALLTLEVDHAPEVELDVVSMLAFVCVSAGRRRQAEEALTRAEALLAGRPDLTRPVVLDLAVARQAEVAADLTAMGAAVSRVLAAGPIYPDNGIAATVAFVQASYLVLAGDLPAARTVLRDNRALNSGTVGLLGVLRDCALAEVEVRLGRPHSALRLLGPSPADALRRHRRAPGRHGLRGARRPAPGRGQRADRAEHAEPVRQPAADRGGAALRGRDRRPAGGREPGGGDAGPGAADDRWRARPAVRPVGGHLRPAAGPAPDRRGPLAHGHVRSRTGRRPAGLDRWPGAGRPVDQSRARRAAPHGDQHVHCGHGRRPSPVGQHGEDPPGLHLPQARGRPAPGGRAAGPGERAALTGPRRDRPVDSPGPDEPCRCAGAYVRPHSRRAHQPPSRGRPCPARTPSTPVRRTPLPSSSGSPG